jgi:hypothetical protein
MALAGLLLPLLLPASGLHMQSAYNLRWPIVSLWISVADQMPPVDRPVLVYIERLTSAFDRAVVAKKGYAVCKWSSVEWLQSEGCKTIKHVTHWRYLPPKPDVAI